MKNLAIALVAISLIAPVNSAQAQFAALKAPGGPGPNVVGSDCASGHVYAGRRADGSLISSAKDATVHWIDECDVHQVWLYFGETELKGAIAKNSKLKAYLRHQGVFPDDVIGVQNRRGKLVVFVRQG